ncbi:hypothetical protein [Streptomyces sp. 6-11-2]|uniref:hypothetical protein n=1 Tax=Streptomyces sp. 6-11-2 TaxID=2585753 RepID=UPI001143BD86|nr:hypothetical protein [Streptomyces sp. 6-11-2]GED87076.1 hypothetical protein TNCT6_41610 [Streptomyces sp. 6-11-2]
MNESFISAEATRLGMVHLAAAVDEYGVIILHESTVSRAQLIRIFENRLRRAEARDDRDVTRLVTDLLSAFNGAQSGELKLIHVQAGKMDVMLYGEASGESILAAVILSGGDS